MFKELAEVWNYRELLFNLVARDMKVRYKNSFLGFLWSFIIPLTQVATLTIMFKYLMHLTLKNYSAYLFCAMIPFNFFSQAVLESTTSILGHAALIKKTYFPREILPAAVVISNLVHLVFAMVAFLGYLFCLHFIYHDGQSPFLATWFLLPVVIAIMFMFTMGISLILACLNTFYEDVKYITSVAMGLIFYGLPILYVIEVPLEKQLHHAWLTKFIHAYFLLNPLSYSITAFRKTLMPIFHGPMFGVIVKHGMPLDYRYLAIDALTSAIVFIIGYAYFNKRKWDFAERL